MSIELLSPAGNIEKLKTAILFGADAVYAGLGAFSLRSVGFNIDEVKMAVDLCHKANKKFFLAINIFTFNKDIKEIKSKLSVIGDIPIDAVIISDPGLIDIIREKMPQTKIHLSTQMNTTNKYAASFWWQQGVSRIILARELSLADIKEIHEYVPALELEIFGHGAMCMSFSGRCLLSQYLTDRNANQGLCAQPCRWEYQFIEKSPTRKIESEQTISPMTIEEDKRGAYIFNSKDLCTINYIPQIIKAGISSLKIEGRMKPAYYVALTTKCYREAIDLHGFKDRLLDPQYSIFIENLYNSLQQVSHRPFTNGFYFQEETILQECQKAGYIKDYLFVGVVSSYKNGQVYIDVRNHIENGDTIEIIDPLIPISGYNFESKKEHHNLSDKEYDFAKKIVINNNMYDQKTSEVLMKAHNQYKITLKIDKPVTPGSIVRKRCSQERKQEK